MVAHRRRLGLVVVEPPADAVHLPELGIRISLDETYRNSGR